jgi:hypothetical protein
LYPTGGKGKGGKGKSGGKGQRRKAGKTVAKYQTCELHAVRAFRLGRTRRKSVKKVKQHTGRVFRLLVFEHWAGQNSHDLKRE